MRTNISENNSFCYCPVFENLVRCLYGWLRFCDAIRLLSSCKEGNDFS
uniref:Uncharacterized protein n=1 Tax=Ascaris lumbricoides TaxID=6252 RepID=A0A0M3ISU5_ASCLU